jgi:hypothetical protein
MRVELAGWAACGVLAALFLAPGFLHGGLGPGDLLLSMTPWAQYHDRFPAIHGVHNPQLDVIQQYFPWRMYAAATLRTGVLPLWNPHAYCGQPFVGNVLSAVFYPFTLLALWLPIGTFFLLSAWCHLTLLGGGMWLLLRDHGLRWPSCLAGAAAIMLNPFVAGWLHYTVVSQWTFGWLPLIVWAWRRAYLPRRPGRLPWTVLLLAVTMLGGHLQIALYVALGWAFYAVGWVLLEGRPKDLLAYVAAPGALAVGLASLQWMPALEMARLSGRQSQPYATSVADAMTPRSLIQCIAPWFYGDNTLKGDSTFGYSYWGPAGNAVESSWGTGCAALWLALVAVCWRRERSVRLFAALGGLALLMALGTPVYWLFWKLVPGFKALRGLPRIMCLWSFAGAALCGFGVEALSADESRPRARAVGVGIVVLTVAGLLAAWLCEAMRAAPGVLTAFTEQLTGYAVTQSAIALVPALIIGHVVFHGQARRAPWLALLVVAELFALDFGQSTGVPPGVLFFATPETDYLTSREEPFRMVGLPSGRRQPFLDWMPMNTPMAYGLSSPSGSESLSFAPYRGLLDAFCEPGWEPKLGSPLLNLVGVRYVLSGADLDGHFGLRRVAGERVGVFENPAAQPLLFATSQWRALPAIEQHAALLAPDFDPRVAIVGPEQGHPDKPEPCVTVSSPRRLTPQRWAAAFECGAPALAVLTQSRVPGWQAWVDGKRTELVPVDEVFCGAALPAGRCDVRFIWRSGTFAVGLFASLLALAVLAAWWVAGTAPVGSRATRSRR